jgi:hypothetical protein
VQRHTNKEEAEGEMNPWAILSLIAGITNFGLGAYKYIPTVGD